ncbi:Zn-ribbon domain-containing OB-fold protein [Oleispirillum naphthae]|uniref:Zn-ribbon domain-containing OB-fold protein n=1 Tax=Oleispirillum naphthae TaxID=2838853 RepID=UPI0030825807
MAESKPNDAAGVGPVPTWRSEGDKVILVGRRCRSCGKVSFSGTRYCDVCWGESFEAVDIGSSGTLYSFSEIHVAPKAFKTPYVIGYVDMSEEVRVFAQVEGSAATLTPGATVEATVGPVRYDENGDAVESYKFRLGGPKNG